MLFHNMSSTVERHLTEYVVYTVTVLALLVSLQAASNTRSKPSTSDDRLYARSFSLSNSPPKCRHMQPHARFRCSSLS